MELIKQNGNSREIYRFWLDGNKYWLDSYSLETKFPPKRKYTASKFWHRIYQRASTITEDEIPWNEDIIAEAHELAVKQIKIGKWKNN